ncbi:MAG: hypothetical protein RL081_352, partial [Pseudomonadota bacterium]
MMRDSFNRRLWVGCSVAAVAGILAGCGSAPMVYPTAPPAPVARPVVVPAPIPSGPGGSLTQPRSRWVPVAWSELPGFGQDNLFEAWNAWLK